jgi:hypothetical protein
MQTQFPADVFAVIGNRFHTQAKFERHLFAGFSFTYERHYLHFSFCEHLILFFGQGKCTSSNFNVSLIFAPEVAGQRRDNNRLYKVKREKSF